MVALRKYQEAILETARVSNTLVVLPTGLGKTLIAVKLIEERLNLYPDSKALFLAPTKPLAEQHKRTLEQNLEKFRDEIVLFTGTVSPKKRKTLFEKARIIVATPQTIQNDILSRNISLVDVSTIVFDEAHRAIGDYAYVFIAKVYSSRSKFSRILALTASPGNDKDKILEVCKNLFISQIEVRSLDDPDVKPYVFKTKIFWVGVDLDENLKKVKSYFESIKKDLIAKFNALKMVQMPSAVSKKTLLMLQAELRKQFPNDPRIFDASSYLSGLIKVDYLLELLETQGIFALYNYILNLKTQYFNNKTKALKKLLNDVRFNEAYLLVKQYYDNGIEHPKYNQLMTIIRNLVKKFEAMNKKDYKIIIFTQFRDGVDKIYEGVNSIKGISAIKFFGQGKKKNAGMTQKQQVQIIEDFKSGKYNCLISTSVGEEGLDIPQVDLVLFYEPIPSAIRSIQRRGRTGRQKEGNVIILYTKKTRDENFRWASLAKEKKMYRSINEVKKLFLLQGNSTLSDFSSKSLKYNGSSNNSNASLNNSSSKSTFHSSKDLSGSSNLKKKPAGNSDEHISSSQKSSHSEHNLDNNSGENDPQNNIGDSDNQSEKILIFVDHREKSNGLVKELFNYDIEIKMGDLAVGDYLLSSKLAVEFKQAPDFVDSILDGRLFRQAKEMKQVYEKPLFLISDFDELYSSRNVNYNAVASALLSLLVDFSIPVIFAKDIKEAARYIFLLAQREQNHRTNINVKKPSVSFDERLRFTVSTFPGVGYVLASPLLDHFKSLKEIINAKPEEIAKIEGFGKKRSEQLYDFFNHEFRS